MRTAVLRSADDITPDTKQAIQPMQIYSKFRNLSDPLVFKRICTYINMSNHNVLYTVGKLQRRAFQKLHFVRIILNRLKAIGEKPQVNQVVPYRFWVISKCQFGDIVDDATWGAFLGNLLPCEDKLAAIQMNIGQV